MSVLKKLDILQQTQYFNLADYNPTFSVYKIFSKIEDKDDSVIDIIKTLEKLGAIDFLVYYREVTHIFCTLNTFEWFDGIYKQFDKKIYDLVCEAETKHFEEKIKPFLPYDEENLKYKKFTRTSTCEYELYLWNIIKESDFIKRKKRNSDINIGIWMPGIFQLSKDKSFFDNLNDYVFPKLIEVISDYIDTGELESLEASFIRRTLSNYIAEFNIFYFVKIQNKCIDLINMGAKDVSKLSNVEFSRFFESDNDDFVCIPESFVENIKNAYDILKYTGEVSKRSALRDLEQYLPFFYLILGKNEKAYASLIECTKSISNDTKKSVPVLIAFYRCILKCSEDYERKRLLDLFDEIFNVKSEVKLFLDVAKDIKKFYKIYSDEFKYCQDEYNKFILHDENIPLSEIKNPKVYRLFIMEPIEPEQKYIIENWLVNDLVVNKMEEIINSIETSKDSIKLITHVHDFLKFFNILSHGCDQKYRLTNMRIDFHDGIVFLNPNNKHLCNKFSEREVFRMYNKEEGRQLSDLNSRIKKIYNAFPSIECLSHYMIYREMILKFFAEDEESFVCKKIENCLRRIQNDSYVDSTEDGLNNYFASVLSGYYGSEHVQREKPQGKSESSKKSGEVDIIIYDKGKELAVEESLIMNSFNKKNFEKHISKLIKKYDTEGSGYLFLVIYSNVKNTKSFCSKLKEYLKSNENVYLKSNKSNAIWIEDENQNANLFHISCALNSGYKTSKLHVYAAFLSK